MDLTAFAQNEKAKKTLLDMVQKKRITHAVLLAGPHGVGKKTFARLMAAAILCEKDTPCFGCNSCKKVLEGKHPDVQEFTEFTKPRSFSVDEVRKIRREAYISPNESEKRIFILANAESMGTEAQNALLKIIEEPPPHAVFILTVQDPSSLLTTVLSRVVTVPISPVDEKTVKKFVAERCDDKTLCETACALSQGSIGRAIEIAENEPLTKAAQTAIDIIKSAVRGDRYETLRLLSASAQSNELFDILDFMAAILENAMTKKDDFISKQITLSQKRVLKMLEAVINAKRSMTFNVNKSLLMTHLCVKMYE